MKEYIFSCGNAIEAADATQSEGIVEELERNGFDIQPHGGHHREYYYTAIKTQ